MFEIDKWTQIELVEYTGTFSIEQGYRKNDDSFGYKTVKEEFGKGNEKVTHKKIPLGNRDKAIEALRYMLTELGAEPVAQVPEDDVPF